MSAHEAYVDVARGQSRATSAVLKRKADIPLNVSRRLVRIDGTETRLIRSHAVRQDLTGRRIVRQILRRHRISGICQRETRRASSDLRVVRRVEHVGAKLKIAAATESDVPGNRQIERARETALQVVIA